ncbi:MAG: hydrogenase expression/formation protein HypE [Armatimonadetes bacterium]|nr:hydrogenase expression/formation protein HypE [Armatimonadota bacterium]
MLGHGSGGKLTRQLICDVFLPAFDNPVLGGMDDQAVLPSPKGKLAFTTDSFVVTPHFFPGGDIGKLAVCGTANDLAMCGARPLHLSASFILEEGLPIEDLRRVADSMRHECEGLGVHIVAGDTKVVPRGACDGLYLSTSGIGELGHGHTISCSGARPGDQILFSGTAGDHGIAVMAAREGIEFETELKSDCAAVWPLVRVLLEKRIEVHAMRDPTRGGVAGVLKEIAESSSVCIRVREAELPVRAEVRAACEMLGLDVLFVPNEGMFVAFVAPHDAERALHLMRAHPLGRNAQIVGEVLAAPAGSVYLRARAGGTRIVDLLPGEMLPRIC